jgi:hypothetical protein
MPKLWSNVLRHWQDDINLLLGIWLFISPWVLGYADAQTAAWHSWGLGLLIGVGALMALIRFFAWEEWINAAFGVWLIVAPWLLGFSGESVAMWNHVVIGVLTAVLAIWSATSGEEHRPATT